MKLADIPYREYVALEALQGIVSRGEAPSKLQVGKAFDVADAFLEAVGKFDTRVADAEAKALRFETKFAVLQAIHVNMGADAPARIALTEIWEMLGVNNQTAAMGIIRGLVGGDS